MDKAQHNLVLVTYNEAETFIVKSGPQPQGRA